MTKGSDTQYLSTIEAAKALGVSISTVKRWVDDGVLPAHRTAGGHRKLLHAEVLALARTSDLPRQDLNRSRSRLSDPAQIRDALHAAVTDGDPGEARSLVLGAYDEGMAIETLADQVIAPVMKRVGHDWETDEIDVWQEHRATQVCVQALFELKTKLEARAEKHRPLAIGAAPAGDFYLLASLLAQMVLMDAGWEATNLGPNTPFASIAQAAMELKPKMIWLSVSYLQDRARFVREYAEFFRKMEQAGVAVAIGGQGLTDSIRAGLPYTSYGDGLSHLAAFARTLHVRPKRPSAGRPRKVAI